MKDKIIEKLVNILESLAGLIMFAMVAVVTIQLIARNFLKISTPWTEEVSRLLLVWMTFIGAPAVLYKGEHLMIDLVYARVNENVRKFINLIISIIICIFCGICLKLGIGLCTNKLILKSVTAAASIPRVYMFLALPVGSLLMLFISLNMLINSILVLLGKRKDDFKVSIVDESKTIDEIEKEESK